MTYIGRRRITDPSTAGQQETWELVEEPSFVSLTSLNVGSDRPTKPQVIFGIAGTPTHWFAVAVREFLLRKSFLEWSHYMRLMGRTPVNRGDDVRPNVHVCV